MKNHTFLVIYPVVGCIADPPFHLEYDYSMPEYRRSLNDGEAIDVENRLVAVSGAATASFTYSGDGQRVKSTIGGVTTIFIGNYAEWNVSAGTMTKYFYAGSSRVAMCSGTCSNVSFLLGDHLGSTSLVVDGSGTQQTGSPQGYLPWGETRFGSEGTKYQYTGQYNETSIGLYYYGARWYDTSLGRFVSPDTIIPEESQGVQAWDRFAYANNSPLKFIDKTGHDVGCARVGYTFCYYSTYSPSNHPPYKTTNTPDIPATAMAQIPFPIVPTATSQIQLNAAFTPNPNPEIKPTSNISLPVQININWSKVDYVDLTINTIGVLGDVAAGVGVALGQPEIVVGSEAVSGIVEFVGTSYEIYEAVNGDPSDLALHINSVELEYLIMAGYWRAIPGFGSFISLVGIWKDTRPQILFK
jgi:RHS repeat-associated protein